MNLTFSYASIIASDQPTTGRTTQFSLLSTSRDTDPPVFSLSFNVTNIPPSTVTCSVDGTMIDIPNEDIDRDVTQAQYYSDLNYITNVLVTVTIRSRQSGSYQCNVIGTSASSMNEAFIVTGQEKLLCLC